MKHHQANFLFRFHLVYLLSNFLHILLHQYEYIHHIHELYLQAIHLHIHHHQNVLTFLLHWLYLLSNILHIYYHLSILGYLFHVFYFHFFPIHHNILLCFRILHFVLILQEHHHLMEDIFQIILKFHLRLFLNFLRLQILWMIHLELMYSSLVLNIEIHFFGLKNLLINFGILLFYELILDCS